jgi:hypothetical protein
MIQHHVMRDAEINALSDKYDAFVRRFFTALSAALCTSGASVKRDVSLEQVDCLRRPNNTIAVSKWRKINSDLC